MDERSALERLADADYLIRVMVRKLGGLVEITKDDFLEVTQSRFELIGVPDAVSGNFVLKLVEHQGGVQ